MTAVASAPMVDGGQDSEKDPNVDQSPSRFTAVNGREPLVPGTGTAVTVPNATPDNEGHREMPENWGRGGYDIHHRQDERARENGNIDQEDRPLLESPSQYAPSNNSRNKRKRSNSGERQDSSHTTFQGASLPRSPVPRPEDRVGSHVLPPGSNGFATAHPGPGLKNTPPPVHPRPEATEGSRTPSTNGPWNEYDSQLINQAQRAQQIDASDAQLAEALQREAQGQDAVQKGWGAINRPLEGGIHEQSSSLPTYGQERPQAAVQVAPKRKRVFSNRTKTGCMTCRRRKKKCDEQHPSCNNCIRGGFLCEGYSSRSTWQKPSNAKAPIPLQSKDGYSDMSSQYIHDTSHQHDRRQSLPDQFEMGKARPLVIDDGDRAAAQYATSPTGVNSNRGSWPKRVWPNAGHSTYIPDHMTKPDYREVPPIHEISREDNSKPDYQVVPSIRELSQGAHPKSGIPLFQATMDQRPAHTSNMDTSSPQAQARMALSIEHQLTTRAVAGEETEKEKMIRGELYRPFDIHLVEERERCKAALWRFNNSCNPVSGLSTKEQSRLLKEVLVPLPNWTANSPSAAASSRSAGSIGQGAVVEAPFHCHYGYNIHISEDVMVSQDCLFVDDCCINIGAHTWIGPKVTILSSMAHANMQERKGSQSRYQGRPVTIEEDCYVGAACIIYPGVRLRRGAYVAPGEVVKTDIVAYGFQGLKPSYM